MKTYRGIFVAPLLLAAAVFGAAIQQPELKEEVPILSQDLEIEPKGKFRYSYETGDGTKSFLEGEVKEVENEEFVNVVRGSYTYVGDDGKTYTVNYVADENGFQAEGEHIPVSPEAIAKSIETHKAELGRKSKF